MNTRTLWIVGSALAHGVFVIAAGRMGAARTTKKDRLVFVEAAPQPKPTEPPKPIDPPKVTPPEAPAMAPKVARAAPQPAAAPKAAEPKAGPEPADDGSAAPLDLGFTMEGGGGPGGLDVGGGGGRGTAPGPTKAAAAPPKEKVLGGGPGASAPCTETPHKPVAKVRKLPKYSEAARAARIEGKVSVKVTVDTDGKVVSATVVSGLGHGLDEEALAAARSWTFEPSTACGKRVTGTTVLGMRFVLQD